MPGPNVTITTRLGASASQVWARATTPEGINHELAPLLRMTVPRGLRGTGIDDVQVGIPLGRSWILLFGLVPVDYDDLSLAELDPGHRFLERSAMLSMRVWQHERSVTPAGEGECDVTDRLTFTLRPPLARLPGVDALATGIVRRLFRHRHRRLAGHFG